MRFLYLKKRSKSKGSVMCSAATTVSNYMSVIQQWKLPCKYNNGSYPVNICQKGFLDISYSMASMNRAVVHSFLASASPSEFLSRSQPNIILPLIQVRYTTKYLEQVCVLIESYWQRGVSNFYSEIKVRSTLNKLEHYLINLLFTQGINMYSHCVEFQKGQTWII